VNVQPKAGEHESEVHGSASLHTSVCVPVHAPPMHWSSTVHALPSVHGAPSAFGGLEHSPVAVSQSAR
jgi:hypothetical protein